MISPSALYGLLPLALPRTGGSLPEIRERLTGPRQFG